MEDRYQRRRFLKYIFSLLVFGAGSIYSFGKNKGLRTEKSMPIGMSSSNAQTVIKTVSRMKTIAIEEAFSTESLLAQVAARVKAGAKYNSVFDYRSGTEAIIFGERRLKEMDEAGIDMQVISHPAYHEGIVDPTEATAMTRIVNDEIYKITRQYPKRFEGFAGLACQDPESATKELERAVKELGLKGAMIYSHSQGEYLDARKYWPIFETAEKLDVPIYIHPEGPPPNMIEPYLDYALWAASWGFAADVGLHAMRLICSGLFDKYPGLKIILGHGGEGLPFWLHRIGMGGAQPKGAVTPILPGTKIPYALCKNRPGDYVKKNFYVTTSGMFWEPVLMFLHTVMGPDRVLFACDYPASNIEDVRSIEALPISNEDKEKIFHLNAENLLKL